MSGRASGACWMSAACRHHALLSAGSRSSSLPHAAARQCGMCGRTAPSKHWLLAVLLQAGDVSQHQSAHPRLTPYDSSGCPRSLEPPL